ncbi:MAG: prephenate dehydrogenase [Lachnospiraceae bacterium]|nr:prephenate dehydrogenase [Lachnospiraceae bacterium]
MKFEKIGFYGLGLIGGSIAKTIKRVDPDIRLYAASGRRSTVEEAYKLGLIENSEPLEAEEFSEMDLVILCAPVTENLKFMRKLKEVLKGNTLVSDVGSVKGDIHAAACELGMEDVFVGGHPMAGSEKTGLANATDRMLENAYYIITPTGKNTDEQVAKMQDFAKTLGAIPLVLDYRIHDRSTAAISHLPHMIAYSLINMVKAEDDESETMRTIAAGGFRDVTRIAASSPYMWEAICLSNRDKILEAMDTFSEYFGRIRKSVESSDSHQLLEYFSDAAEYRNSLFVNKPGAIRKTYEFYVDLLDELGGIATVSCILAFAGISIKNIGIVHNREYEEGVLRLELYDGESMDKAVEILGKRGYTVHRR